MFFFLLSATMPNAAGKIAPLRIEVYFQMFEYERNGISSNLHRLTKSRKATGKWIQKKNRLNVQICMKRQSTENWILPKAVTEVRWCLLSIVFRKKKIECILRNIYSMQKKTILFWRMTRLWSMREKKPLLISVWPKIELTCRSTSKKSQRLLIAFWVLIQCKVAHLDKLHHVPASLACSGKKPVLPFKK